MCKKELLDKAFTEAVTELNLNIMAIDKEVATEAIETSMKAFAEREKADFTEDEIKATIVAGLDTFAEIAHKDDVDSPFNGKMML